MPAPVHCRPVAHARFADAVARLDTVRGLWDAAVAISMHEMDDVDPALVDRRVEALAEKVRARAPSGRPEAVHAHLHDVFFEEEGFIGNAENYYDPRNSYVPAVLYTKRGIPIALTLLYKRVADLAGIVVKGVNAPGHFLALVWAGDEELLIDPFAGGRVLSEEEAFARLEQVLGEPVPRHDDVLHLATHRDWIDRMLRNLMMIFGQRGEGDHLAAMNELRSLL